MRDVWLGKRVSRTDRRRVSFWWWYLDARIDDTFPRGRIEAFRYAWGVWKARIDE